MKRTLVVAAAAASLSLVGLTGCAADDDQVMFRSIVAQVSPAPSGPVLSVEQAGKIYLRLAAVSNAAREAWMSAGAPTATTLAAHKRLATRSVDATVAFSQGLRKYRWPSHAQPIVDALDLHFQDLAAAYRRVAQAGTVAEYLAAAYQVPVTTSLTGDLRKALGLPEGAVVKGVSPRQNR